MSESPEVAATDQPVRHSLLRNMVAMGTSQMASWGLGLVSQIVQPRFLGPAGLGQIQLAFSLWAVVQAVVGLGTGIFLTLEMARDRERGVAAVGPIIVLRVCMFVPAAAAIAVYAMIVGFERDMFILLGVVGLTVLVNVLQEVFAAAVTGMELMSYVSVANVLSKLVYTGLMVVVLVAGGGVIGLAWATVFNATLALGIIVYFYRRMASISFVGARSRLLPIVRASRGFVAGLVILVVYAQVDMVVMSLLVEERALGWYTSADVLRSSLGFVPLFILGALFPVLGRLHVTDHDAVAGLVHRAFRMLLLIGIPMGFGTAAVARPVAELLFGRDFGNAGDVLAVFGLCLPLTFATTLLGQASFATGQEWFWNKLMLAAIVMSIAFDIVFVPLMDRETGNGAIGGALGYIVTESFMVVVAVRRVAPSLLEGDAMVRVSKTVLAGAVMFLAAWPVRDRFLLLPVVIGAAVFVVAIGILRVLTEEDRTLLTRLGARLGVPNRLLPSRTG